MRKIWSIVALGVLGVAPLSVGAETLTDALISAYRNSHLLEQNQAVLRAADEDLASAVGALLPVFSWEASINATGSYSPQAQTDFFGNARPQQTPISTSDMLGLFATITILDFGRGQLNIELKNSLVRASQHSLVYIEQQVLQDAMSAYVNVGLQERLVAAQQKLVQIIIKDLAAEKDRFDVGEVTRTDVALAEARLATANSQLAAAQGSYDVARENYKAAIGHYPSGTSSLPAHPTTAKSLNAAREIALRTHPAILQAQEQAKASDIAVELARAQMQPNVTGQASLQQSYSDRGNSDGNAFTGGQASAISENLAITLRQTIYQGGQLSSQLRKQIAQSQSAHSSLLQTVVNVDEAVGRAWSNIIVSKASIIAGDQQIVAEKAAYDGVRQEAELGSRTTLDVLDAERNLLTANTTRLQAGANLYVSEYALLSAMGLLTASHLRLGVPIFDPSAYLNAVKHAPATTARGAKLDRILKTLGK